MNWKAPVSVIQALCVIVGSMFVVSGGVFALWTRHFFLSKEPAYEPVIASLIQTGPQRQALPTDYLAQLLNLSSDRPLPVKHVDCSKLQSLLLRSSLISSAQVTLLKPGTLYVDYEVRQPIAWLEDYENVAIDKEGYMFPFAPFFSPKNIPGFYLGVNSFVNWNTPVKGELFDLCLAILSCVNSLDICDQFRLLRIDVSNALASSCGRREVVVITEDVFIRHCQGQDVEYRKRRFLRMNPKTFPQALSNYLSLRKQLLEEEQKNLPEVPSTESVALLKDQVLDFRIDQLAFIPNE